ncbi:MAG: ABC transporter permease subunit [Chloroflexales bacterium]|nr:ABC transporter permease subunit [Chloroflexales bacterium]
MVTEERSAAAAAPQPPRRPRRWRAEPLITAATLGGLLLVWSLVAGSGLVPAYFVPAPRQVWLAFTDILAHGYRGHSLAEHLGASLRRVLLAFFGAAAIGVPLGMAIGSSTKVGAIFDPLIEFYRPLPPLAYYTLLIIWLGIEDSSKIMLLWLAGLPPVLIATAAAVRAVRKDYIHGARSLGASRRQIFQHVVFPACLPAIFTGLRVSIGFTYTTLVAAEMVAGVNGIGWMVLDASKFLQSDVIFVGILLMGLTGLLLDGLLRLIERLVVPWHGRA